MQVQAGPAEGFRRVTNEPQRDEDGPLDEGFGVDPPFWEALDLPEPEYAECDDPPAVDEDDLRRLLHRRLSDERAQDVLRLVYTFKNWREAYDRITLEEVRKRSRPHGNDAF
jgi:hypothetical protein